MATASTKEKGLFAIGHFTTAITSRYSDRIERLRAFWRISTQGLQDDEQRLTYWADLVRGGRDNLIDCMHVLEALMGPEFTRDETALEFGRAEQVTSPDTARLQLDYLRRPTIPGELDHPRDDDIRRGKVSLPL